MLGTVREPARRCPVCRSLQAVWHVAAVSHAECDSTFQSYIGAIFFDGERVFESKAALKMAQALSGPVDAPGYLQPLAAIDGLQDSQGMAKVKRDPSYGRKAAQTVPHHPRSTGV